MVGGHGKIALKLHPLLVEAGHTPIALVRSENYHEELEQLGAILRVLDIENATLQDFEHALEGVDVVVFSAGGGPDGSIERKRTVDLEGSLSSQTAAANLGIQRFIQVSAIRVDEPTPEDSSAVWKAYVDAKAQADKALRASGLDWTILRPGQLTDKEPTGAIELAEHVETGPITRSDVAAVIAAVIDDDASIRKQWELVNGSVPIAQAIAEATTSR